MMTIERWSATTGNWIDTDKYPTEGGALLAFSNPAVGEIWLLICDNTVVGVKGGIRHE